MDREQELAKTIANAVNTFSFDDKAFCETMAQEHKTLQQTFTGLCLSWIRHCGSLEPWQIDGRNEASAKTCKMIAQFMEEEDIGRLPMV